MAEKRPRIRPELVTEIERRRQGVPFERYVNGLIRIALDEVGAHEHDTPPPGVEATVDFHTRETLPRRKAPPSLKDTWRR